MLWRTSYISVWYVLEKQHVESQFALPPIATQAATNKQEQATA